MHSSLKRAGFKVKTVYRFRQPSVVKVAQQKLSFLIASMSLFAFVIGNMVGQHGWYAFWKTVLGKEDDSAIVFVGTVSPITKVPDYSKWASYGGSSAEHTYRLVPQDLLIPIPAYDAAALRNRTGENLAESVYSVGNLGSYETGDDHGGSHVGVDIRVPMQTPVVSIANGIVEKVSRQEYGYGHYVMVRHPNVPDAEHPGKTMTIYSVYAHLDATLVIEGQVVHKGEQIATSGMSGDATGPHLHFQIDRGDAPFHPFWPFSDTEARQAGITFAQAINSGFHQDRGDLYTLSPMLFVQAHQSYVPTNIAQATSSSVSSSVAAKPMTVAERRAARLAERVVKAGTTRPIVTSVIAVGGATQPVASSSSSSAPAQVTVQTVAQSEDVVPIPAVGLSTEVDHLKIEHSGKLSRTWQKVKILALDKNGDLVSSPSFAGRLYVISEFGEAEIRPSELTPLDFVNGVATVNVLARGSKTTFISTRGAFNTMSGPMISTTR